MQKFQAKQAVLVVLFKAKGLYSSSKSQLNFLNHVLLAILHSTQQNSVLQHY